MKNRFLIGLILVFFILSACTSSVDSPTSAVGTQPTMDITPEDFALQTIIAREQSTSTPKPAGSSNLTNPWTDLTSPEGFTPTPIPTSTPKPPPPTSTPKPPTLSPISAIAQALTPDALIYQGPGTNYKMACFVDEGTQLLISGRNINSSWLTVTFLQGQTCLALPASTVHPIVIPDPTKQYWIFSSSYSISGDLSRLPIITEAPQE